MFIATCCFATALVASPTVPTPAKVPFSTAYGECTDAAQMRDGGSEVRKKCEEPARQGFPGAQYALGEFLVKSNDPADIAAGIEWLEKAAASGHQSAAMALARVLLVRKDEASVNRGRQLFRDAACAGHPTAVKALAANGVTRDALKCLPSAEESFTGDWILSLRWDKSAPAGPETASYRIRIGNDIPQVFYKIDDKWVEAKRGRFRITQEGETATIAVHDVGWDFDGKWIETWTIQLMRTGAEEAAVAFLRTVNNPHLPPQFAWRTFTTFAEGTARREKQ